MALSAARCPSPRSMAGALSLCDVLLFPVCSRWPSSSPRPRTRGPRLPFPRRAHRGSSECPLTEGRRDSTFQGSSPSPGGPLGAGGLATLWFSCPQKTAFPCQASVYRSASRVCGPRAHGHVLIRDVYPMDVCLGKSPAGGLSRSTVTSPHPTPPGTPRPPFQSSFQGTPFPRLMNYQLVVTTGLCFPHERG